MNLGAQAKETFLYLNIFTLTNNFSIKKAEA